MQRVKLLCEILLLALSFTTVDAGRYVSLNTTSDHTHYFLNDLGIHVKARTLVFDVTSTADAIIRLAQQHTLSGSLCDIIIGSSSNTAIAVRENCNGCGSFIMASGTFLSATTPSVFWLDWSDGTTLRAGEGSVIGELQLFTHHWQSQFEVNYLTATSYYGNEGQWNFLIDTPPVFTSPSPDGSTFIVIAENLPINSSVTTVTAYDDEADNVIFTLIGEHADQFFLDGNDIKLKEQLDYEARQWFLVEINATDGRHNTTVICTLRVSDVNDETPVLTSGPVTSVQEELPVGTVITELFAVDDADQGDTLIFTLQGNHSLYFSMNDTSGEVTVAKRIDREDGLSNLNDLWLVVTDTVHHSATLKLDLMIQDINDNRPQFETEVNSVNVSSFTTSDTPILSFNVTDADEGNNSDVTISLMTSTSGFTILGTGLFVNVSELDVNSTIAYTLIIEAVDNPTEGVPLTAISVVEVQVIRSNDHAPVWVHPVPDSSGFMPDLSLQEDIASGTWLLSFSARDDDIGVYGDVTFQMTSAVSDSGSNATHLFFIHPTSGDLQTTGTLDRDTNTGGTTFYLLTFKVQDAGSRSSEAKLKVALTDVNDNPPTFDQNIYQTLLPCSSPVGATVISLAAADNDVNSTLTFAFVGGGSDYFALNDATGDVTLKTNVTTMTLASNIHVLTVNVRDGGVPELTSTAAVVVKIDKQCSVNVGYNTSEADTEDLHKKNRILTIACGIVGAGFLLSTIMLVIAKVSHATPVAKVEQSPINPHISHMWVKRQHHPGSTVPSCSSNSQRGSSADTRVTDCSSLNSLRFV